MTTISSEARADSTASQPKVTLGKQHITAALSSTEKHLKGYIIPSSMSSEQQKDSSPRMKYNATEVLLEERSSLAMKTETTVAREASVTKQHRSNPQRQLKPRQLSSYPFITFYSQVIHPTT